MTLEEILSKLDYILKKFNELETVSRDSLAFDIKIGLIRNAVAVLRIMIEESLKEEKK